MNSNSTKLPRDCQQVSQEYEFEVIAETSYAVEFPGNIFGLSQHEYKVEPCSRITVTFINQDEVRHQWMVHGLPKYLYDAGMFHLEAAGGQQQTGTFIVPSEDKTYLVHCDIAQHMEKGMKAQLVVGKGNGDLWGVPSISNNFYMDTYLPSYSKLLVIIAFIIGVAVTTFIILNKQ
ncbi:MAG: multicopper oxidase domain-containing protein [Gammaproteobacteria bacterium]|nr:multicopper oxidase domain-containing protein [Gammaproteobacteria bacterium]